MKTSKIVLAVATVFILLSLVSTVKAAENTFVSEKGLMTVKVTTQEYSNNLLYQLVKLFSNQYIIVFTKSTWNIGDTVTGYDAVSVDSCPTVTVYYTLIKSTAPLSPIDNHQITLYLTPPVTAYYDISIPTSALTWTAGKYTLKTTWKCGSTLISFSGLSNPDEESFTLQSTTTPPPSCTNDCSRTGSTACSGSGIRTCGNYDSDACLEWSSVSSCGSGKVCIYNICQVDVCNVNSNKPLNCHCTDDLQCNSGHCVDGLCSTTCRRITTCNACKGILCSDGCGGTIPGTRDCSVPQTGTCSDGIQNQGETGVDCGGPCTSCSSSPNQYTSCSQVVTSDTGVALKNAGSCTGYENKMKCINNELFTCTDFLSNLGSCWYGGYASSPKSGCADCSSYDDQTSCEMMVGCLWDTSYHNSGCSGDSTGCGEGEIACPDGSCQILDKGCCDHGIDCSLLKNKTIGDSCESNIDCDSGFCDVSGWMNKVLNLVVNAKTCQPTPWYLVKKIAVPRDKIATLTTQDQLAIACLSNDQCLKPSDNYTASCIPLANLKSDGTIPNTAGFFQTAKDTINKATNGVIVGGLLGAAVCVGGTAAAVLSSPTIAGSVVFGSAAATACSTLIAGGAIIGGAKTITVNKKDPLVKALDANDEKSVGLCVADTSSGFDYCKYTKWADIFPIVKDDCQNGLINLIIGLFLALILFRIAGGGK